MKRKINKNSKRVNLISYGFGNFADIISTTFIMTVIFVFYVKTVETDLIYISIAFIIWSVWNAVNDPLIGALSDRTKTKWGRRKPWIIAGIGPMMVLLVVMWTVPVGDDVIEMVYLLVTLFLFDTFFTMYSLNMTSLFPEMYQELEERSKANTVIQGFSIVGLLIANLIPGAIIGKHIPNNIGNYPIAGFIVAIIVGFSVLIMLKFGGIRERKEFSNDSESAPSYLESMKLTFRNKSFRTYIVANFAVFYVFTMLTTISPFYAEYVIGVSNTFIQSVALGLALVSSAVFMIFWQYIAKKYGVKTGQIASMTAFIITLVPAMFITEIIGGLLFYLALGLGLAGALFFRAVSMSTIVDDDELKTGIRREGSYYGVNAFLTRLTTIAVIITINLVLSYNGFSKPSVDVVTDATIFGLRSIVFIFPAIALAIGILSMSRFPIDKERYQEIKRDIDKLHQDKKTKVQS